MANYAVIKGHNTIFDYLLPSGITLATLDANLANLPTTCAAGSTAHSPVHDGSFAYAEFGLDGAWHGCILYI